MSLQSEVGRQVEITGQPKSLAPRGMPSPQAVQAIRVDRDPYFINISARIGGKLSWMHHLLPIPESECSKIWPFLQVTQSQGDWCYTFLPFWGREKLLSTQGHLEDTSCKLDFPGSSADKESACNEGDISSIPGLGRSPGEGKRYPLQYSGLQNSMDCLVHGVAKSWTWLSDFHFHFLSSHVNWCSHYGEQYRGSSEN